MQTTKHLIILGPPGSGKGTQAKLLQEKFGLFFFGTGDLMRKEAESNSEIGQKFQAVWDKGEGGLVSSELINEFVNLKLQKLDKEKGIIFDGYPRTIQQAENLEKVLQILPENLIVLNIEVSKDLLVERMETRRVCGKCKKIFFRPTDNNIQKCDDCGGELIQRQEDQPEVIRKRIEVYEAETKPLVEFYKAHGTLINIDGNPPIDKVTVEINEKLQGILG